MTAAPALVAATVPRLRCSSLYNRGCVAPTLSDLLPYGPGVTNDLLLDRFLDYVADRGLTLYPAQEEAILALLDGQNVILNTPTGSGKSLVATALLFAALARGERAVCTFPIKALVNEKWMQLCREFGPEYIGLATGDASVNRDAPILCCTAEILGNIALRQGAEADIQHVVMDEFHYYADRDRGVAWQTPLLTMGRARFLLMSATLGDTTPFEQRADRAERAAHRHRPVRDAAGAARVRLRGDPAAAHHREAGGRAQDPSLRGPLHPGGRRGQRAGLHQPEDRHARAEGGDRGRASRPSTSAAPTAAPSASGFATGSACTTRGCCRSTACSSSSSRSSDC